MAHAYHDIAFTETVKALQQANGSRDSYARFEEGSVRGHQIGPREAGFIAERDSFYMASVSETGWPYLQHRGGPKGFLRTLDEHTLGFADYSGNRQYVSLGNFETDNRVSLFLMDYANRQRLKIFGRAYLVEPGDMATLTRLDVGEYSANVECGIRIVIDGVDWNCPQHITPRYDEAQVARVVEKLTARIVELEETLAGTAAGAARD